ncbi:MAG: DUF421 domain-containing protein [Clostridia bacterium]
MLDNVYPLEMITRATVTFLVLMVLTRLLGKKQISQLTFFNYVAGITMGSIAGEISGQSQTPFFNGLISLIWWFLLTILVGFISLKSRKGRVLIDGEPSIVIKKGKILEQVLADARLNMDDLSMLLREKDIFAVNEVEYAILEPNGQLSVLKKPEYESVAKQDLHIAVSPILYLPAEVIVDGKIVYKNLRELNLTQAWLGNELQKAGITSPDEVFYAEIQTDGTLHIDKRNDLLQKNE